MLHHFKTQQSQPLLLLSLFYFKEHSKDTLLSEVLYIFFLCLDREKAFGIAKQLLEKKFLTPVKSNDDMSDDKTLFRLLEDSRSSALNAGLPAYAKVADGEENADSLNLTYTKQSLIN